MSPQILSGESCDQNNHFILVLYGTKTPYPPKKTPTKTKKDGPDFTTVYTYKFVKGKKKKKKSEI